MSDDGENFGRIHKEPPRETETSSKAGLFGEEVVVNLVPTGKIDKTNPYQEVGWPAEMRFISCFIDDVEGPLTPDRWPSNFP